MLVFFLFVLNSSGAELPLGSKWLSARQEDVNAPERKESCVLEGATGQERWRRCLMAVLGECRGETGRETMAGQKKGRQRNQENSEWL